MTLGVYPLELKVPSQENKRTPIETLIRPNKTIIYLYTKRFYPMVLEKREARDRESLERERQPRQIKIKKRRQSLFVLCLTTLTVIDFLRLVYPAKINRTRVLFDLCLATSFAIGFDVITLSHLFCFHIVYIIFTDTKISNAKTTSCPVSQKNRRFINSLQ